MEPRLQNATVAFDAERLEPTFRLEYGHPGPSHALTIGQRLGLPPEVIARARDARRRRGPPARSPPGHAGGADAGGRGAGRAGRPPRGGGGERRSRAPSGGRAPRTEARRAPARGGAAGLGAPGRCAPPRGSGARAPEERRGRRRRAAQEAYRRLRAAEATLQPVPVKSDEPAPPGEVQLRGLGLRGRVVAEADGLVTVQAGSLTVRVARSEIEPPWAAAQTPGPAVSLPVAGGRRSGAPPPRPHVGRGARGGREVPRRRGAGGTSGDPAGPRQGDGGAPARGGRVSSRTSPGRRVPPRRAVGRRRGGHGRGARGRRATEGLARRRGARAIPGRRASR